MSSSTHFTSHIVSQKILEGSPFFLVDVGASGGIEPKWNIFSPYLSGVGFDPLVNECSRLNQLKRDNSVVYVDAYIDGPSSRRLPQGLKTNSPAGRFSSQLAREMIGLSSKDSYNSFQDVVYTEQRFALDEYPFASSKLDFLKIDTDGHDIHVLHGAKELFEKNQFLGVCIESQFHGPAHPYANTFANIDIFLRDRGFSLFDIKMYRYSRRDLPGVFSSGNLSHTDIGQVHWADAYFFRDLGDKDYSSKWDYTYDNLDVIKLACLYEIHGLHDCAVELLNLFRDRLKVLIDIEYAMNLLAPPIHGKVATIADYQDRFQKTVHAVSSLQGKNLNQLSDEQREDLKKKNKILLFGAGSRMFTNISFIRSQLNQDAILVICDNDKKKWGTLIGTMPVISPNEIGEFSPDAIIIVSIFYHDIAEQILEISESSRFKCLLYYI